MASFIHQGGLNVLTYRGERQTQREEPIRDGKVLEKTLYGYDVLSGR